MRYIASIILLAALSASPGCSATLGRITPESVGGAAGAAAGALIPGAHLADPVVEIITNIADSAAQKRIDELAPGEKPGLWTTVLGTVAAAGMGFLGLRQRRQTAHIDELYDATKEIAVKTATVPKPPGT